MASAEQYAAWIVQNADKKGTPEFETVAQAYQLAKQQTAPQAPAAPEPSMMDSAIGGLKNTAAGALAGAAGIGSTLLAPYDYAKDAIMGTEGSNAARRASVGDFFKENADPEALTFKAGKLGTEIAGTSGVGGLLAKGAAAIPQLAKFAPALASGGFNLGGAATNRALTNTALRAGAGGLVGGTQAAMLDPSTAGMGAAIGAAMPPAAQAAGKLGAMIAPKASPAVAALYKKAQDLGIEIPADRLTNSRPLNAMAASLNYVPFSGRMAAEDKMLSSLNRAASRTMGQDTPNITQALDSARKQLGRAFDDVLQSTPVTVDDQLLKELADAEQTALAELVPEQARIIKGQIDNIMGMAKDGRLEGQAAYNIKRTLDRIAKRNTPEAFYAGELRGKVIDALNRSLGPEDAAMFAKVREQYGNMMTLRKLAPNGAEGEITAGRLANLRDVKSKDLKDVADIAAQFVRTRENPHGAAQRVVLGGLGLGGLGAGAATGTLPLALTAMGAGRLANTALSSKALANLLMSQSTPEMLYNPLVRAAPVSILSGQ